MPAKLQLGLLAYTDWSQVQTDPNTFNMTPNRLPGDLIVRSDYVRFTHPDLPESLVDKAYAGTITNDELTAVINAKK